MRGRVGYGWLVALAVSLVACVLAVALFAAHATTTSQAAKKPDEMVELADRRKEPLTEGKHAQEPSEDSLHEEGSTSEGGQDVDAAASGAFDGPSYTIPEDAEFAPDIVLVSIPSGMSAAEVEAMLAETDAVGSVHVSEEDLASGVVAVEVANGMDVEDAINEIRDSHPELVAQPNFYYHAMFGDEGDLRALLEEETVAGAGELVEPADDAGVVVNDEPDQMDVADTEEPSQEEPAALPDEESLDGREEESSSEEAALDGQAGEALDDPEEDSTKGDQAALMEALSVTTDDPFVDKQWALANMQAFEAWSIARCEGKVAIAVLDLTPDVTHADLAGNVAYFYDVHADSSTMGSVKRHGTHVTGVASAVSNNAAGVAGISYNATLLVMNVFDSSGNCSTDDLCKAYSRLMAMADTHNLHVINLSLGGKVSSPKFVDDAFLAAVDKAYEEHDIVTVAAAANASASAPVPYYEYPGDAERVVSVMNLRQVGDGVERSPTSNYNVAGQRGKNICAPGTSIYSTVLNGGYGNESGTSMAAPQVSGVLALEFAANPSLTAAEAVSILYNTAIDLGDPGWDEGYGYGEANAYAAVLAANPLLGAEITVSPSSFVFDGSAHTPEVTVMVDGTRLVEGEDYRISFANNVNAGKATATVVSEIYGGSASATFVIEPARIEDADVSLSATSFSYTGGLITPKVRVVVGNQTLSPNIDYSIRFSNNIQVGEAFVTVEGKGNYSGLVKKSFVIEPHGSWVSFSKGWRYQMCDGTYLKSRFLDDESKTYWFDSDGWMATGWQSIGGSWYYFRGSGAMAKGWLRDGGSWYWLDASSGRMKTGWVSVSGADYWMRPSGAMATGWQSIGGSWYYFRGSGAMAKDCWIGNYRLGTDGAMMTSTRTPDGYYVGPDGKWDGKQRAA